MKIGIDARMYGSQQGGLGRYIEQLILHLEKIDSQNEYVIFLRSDNWNDFNPINPKFRKVLANISWYGWQEQLLLPSIIKKEKLDLMHFPHWNVPIFFRGDFIMTIHDLLLLHFPSQQASTLGPLKYWIKNFFFKITLNKAAKRAKKIITISEFSKQDIIKTLKISPRKICVTLLSPLPVSTTYNPPFSLRNKYDIHKPYWLYVGVAYPHKNLDKLISAWKIFSQKNLDFQLVLVGKFNYFYNQLIDQVKQENIHDVIFTDYVPDLELAELYQNASLYVFPSLYEGFGLPPLEAMQYELPVISSNATCLPEILSDAALYFDPKNELELISKAELAINDEVTRTRLIQNGHKLLFKYSWETTAKQTLRVYEEFAKISG